MSRLVPRRTPGCRRARSVVAIVIIGVVIASLVGASTARPVRADELPGGSRATDRLPMSPPSSGYEPPVDATVIDPFRAPADRYAAGNRGIDYATSALTPVRAAGDGEVIFAGPVAGALHVTVRHGDGLRTTYSFLATVAVGRGQYIRRGEPVGLSADFVHFGVRDADGNYLDPAMLFAAPVGAHLVPGGDDNANRSVVDETPVLAAVVADRLIPLQRVLERVTPDASPAGLLDRARLWGHLVSEATPAPHVARMLTGLRAWHDSRARCTERAVPPPAPTSRRILVEVAGIGSTSSSASVASVDTGALGYAPGDVVRFSYGGGQVPPSGPSSAELAGLPTMSYDSRESQGDLPTAGRRLADLLTAIARAAPGVPVDVVAHSQGGVVARLALAAGEDGQGVPPEVQTLVTLGSPHDGADVAAAIAAGRLTGGGRKAESAIQSTLGLDLDAGLPAGTQLAPTSPVIRGLAGRPPPASVRTTAIGARGDLVVPAGRTRIPGADHTVLPLTGIHAHDALPGHPAATREIALAIAGRPPTCRTLTEVVSDLVTSEAISHAEALTGLAAAHLVTTAGPV